MAKKNDIYHNQYGYEDPKMRERYMPREYYEIPGQKPADPKSPNYKETPMSIGQYVVTLILPAIPLFGWIVALAWLFGKSRFRARVNYVRASFVISLFVAVIGGVLVGLMLGGILVIPGFDLQEMFGGLTSGS